MDEDKKKVIISKVKELLKEIWSFLSDILYNAVIIIALVVIIRSFIISPFRVVGASMADTLESSEFILIDKFSYIVGKPDRGDPIVFLPPITSRYPHKFEERVTTDANGVAKLDISKLKTQKTVAYCQKKLSKILWLCDEKVYAEDPIYFRPAKENETGKTLDSSWDKPQKRAITAGEVENGMVTINGLANQSYLVRIYNHFGSDYFVKRIIGIPEDEIKIENGRVYLKKPGENQFKEIDETYLNDENNKRTYFPKKVESTSFKVPQEKYFVLGDNRNHSNDSRSWFSPIDQSHTPFVSLDEISGKVTVVLWPIMKLRFIGGSDL